MSNIVTPSTTPKWTMPGQKVWAGGLSFVAAWFLLQGASMGAAWLSARYGIPIIVPQDQSALTAVAAGISYVVQYFVPPSIQDVITQVNTRLGTLAQTDKNVAASLITAASNAPATHIVTTPEIAAVAPANVKSNTTSAVVTK